MWTHDANHEWIAGVCRQLSKVTGWPTTFAPPRGLESDGPFPGDYSWNCDVSNGEEVIGTLSVALPPGRELDDRFLRACESADLTGQLIQRVLIQQTQTRPASAIDTHSQTDTADSVADTWESSVNRILDVALRLTGFRAAALFVLDPHDDCLRLRAERTSDRATVMMYGRSLSEAPFDVRALQHQSVVIRRKDREFSEWLPDGMSLGVCRGISTSQGPQGTLWVFDRRDRRLTVRDEQILQSIVLRLGDLIEQAVLVQESTLQRQLRAELRIASESQPSQLIDVSGVGGWCQVAGHMESASEVGGDLCEVIPLGDERMLIAIGDAAGHSIPAAMVMATMRGALRVMVGDESDDGVRPERILSRLNRVLHSIVESHQFMTLTCAIIDGVAGTLTLANAGHPPPLLIREGEVIPIESHGLLLGVVNDAEYSSRIIPLQPDDLLAFYTDGVSEAADEKRVLFRSEGIAEVIGRHLSLPPTAIVERVWNAFESHLDNPHTDDRTLLIARFSGRTAALELMS